MKNNQMTNILNDQERGFVLHHYRKGVFNPDEALKKVVRPTRRIPMRRWVAAVASLLCLVAFAAVLTWQLNKTDAPAQGEMFSTLDRQKVTEHPTASFHFDDTPLPDVLAELSKWYGEELKADNSEKHLTGDFAADSLDAIINMIEEVLDVEITRVEP